MPRPVNGPVKPLPDRPQVQGSGHARSQAARRADAPAKACPAAAIGLAPAIDRRSVVVSALRPGRRCTTMAIGCPRPESDMVQSPEDTLKVGLRSGPVGRPAKEKRRVVRRVRVPASLSGRCERRAQAGDTTGLGRDPREKPCAMTGLSSVDLAGHGPRHCKRPSAPVRSEVLYCVQSRSAWSTTARKAGRGSARRKSSGDRIAASHSRSSGYRRLLDPSLRFRFPRIRLTTKPPHRHRHSVRSLQCTTLCP